jgi:1-deoxy-D-xylulose-5-phosphate reductoisomerase
MIRTLAVFGSTGSIGTNTLALAERFTDRFRVVTLTAGRNLQLLREQITRFDPRRVAVGAAPDAEQLRAEFPRLEVFSGDDGLCQVARAETVDVAVMGIVGFAALAPTLEVVPHCRTLALANKEALVVAGSLLRKAVAAHEVTCVPVDSEHNALYQLLQGRRREEIASIVLTASGGPLFRRPEVPLDDVTPAMAIQHPNWKMGPKISVDSATLMNKGLELIEAAVLFDFAPQRIEVWIHPQSIVHGAIWFVDNSCLAQLSKPDMRSSIGFAMEFPDRLPAPIPKLSPRDFSRLEFHEPDDVRFPALRLARQALESGPSFPVALNAANEVAVGAFLRGELLFSRIPEVVEAVLQAHRAGPVDSVEAIFAADAQAREAATQRLRR